MPGTTVAVIKDGKGEIASFANAAFIEEFVWKEGAWSLGRSFPFGLGGAGTPSTARAKARELLAALGGTRVLVGRAISGVAYTVLDQAGLALCEMDAFSPDCLDALAETINTPESGPAVPDKPVETGVPGCYVLDLKAALAAWPDLSSKKILRPFLKNTFFVELNLLCAHVPPWLPPELEGRGMTYREAPSGGDVTLVIAAPSCNTEDTPCHVR